MLWILQCQIFNPLTSPGTERSYAYKSAFVGALAQIRYPKIMAIRQDDYVARFQESIRHDYHIYEKEEDLAYKRYKGISYRPAR